MYYYQLYHQSRGFKYQYQYPSAVEAYAGKTQHIAFKYQHEHVLALNLSQET